MTFKQFKQWCNERACDGCWGYNEAVYCIELLDTMMKIPFWRRNKVWKLVETKVLYAVVNPINQKIQEVMSAKMDGDGNEKQG